MAAHSDSAQVRKPAKEVPCKSSCSSNPGLRIGFVTLAGIICAVITESSLLLFADGQRYSRRTHGEEKWTLSSLHGTGAHDDTTRHSQLVYPVIIDGGGDIIDHNLEMLHPLHLMSDVARESESHRRLRRSSGILQEVRVRVSAFNRDFHFLLEPNLDLLSNHLQLDYHINQSATPTPSSASSSEQTEDDEQRSRRPTALDVSHLIGCFMSGRLEEDSESQAAINVCNGMTGMFVSGDREFIIEPVQSTSSSSSGEHTAGDNRYHPHLLTQTTRSSSSSSSSSSSTVQRRRMQTNADSAQQRVQRFNGVQCGVKEKAKGTALPAPVMTDQDDVAVSGDDSSNQGDGRYGNGDSDGHRQRRSVSYRYYVETYIVADDAFYRRHGDASIHIMLNAMNMVSTLFKDPTLGNNVKITTSKINIGQQGLRKQYRVNVDNATQTLDNFCQWQSEMNGTRVTAGGGLSSYHDVAVLFTGENMCSRPNTGCEVVGIGKMGGMCSSRRSCSVAEDTGLFIAFTIAHELGHNFNMPHDGDGNKCGIGYGKRYVPGLMANKASNISKAYQWSKCSRDYITDFLDGGGGECLRNPSNNTRRTNLEYGAREQCQLSYGPNSVPCREDSSMCQSLWCTTNNRERCTMRSLPPLSGTPCPLHSSNPHVKDGVCHRGNCLPPQSLQPVDGGWNDWSEWGACSLTCGRGIRKRDRQCTNPEPVNNGHYCIGERAQYRFCVEADVQDQCGYVDGEALWKYQCSFFDSYRFGDQLATARDGNWTVPNNIVTNRKPTCSLDCYNGRHVRTLAQHVIDGTPCTFDSSDICVSGRCVAVGCDGNLATDNGDGSGTVKRMSVCGQCGGNNSACVTVTRRWRSWRDARRQTGSVFVMALPGGATTVRIQEKDPLAETFIGLVANDSRQEIISTTSIKAAGYHRVSASPDVYIYRRLTHVGMEVEESLHADGPLTTPTRLTFYIPDSSMRRTLLISYYLPKNHAEPRWVLGNWQPCAVTCGPGQQQRRVHCYEGDKRVRTRNCRKNGTTSKPPEHMRTRKCQLPACRLQTRWFEAPQWGPCMDRCEGDSPGAGMQSRTVLCLKRDGSGWLTVQDDRCDFSKKPDTERQCSLPPAVQGVNQCHRYYLDCPQDCQEECPGTALVPGDLCTCQQVTNINDIISGGILDNPARNFTSQSGCEQQLVEKRERCRRYMWHDDAWQDCASGQEIRNVTCLEEETQRPVDESLCSNCEKPRTQRPCQASVMRQCPHADNLSSCRVMVAVFKQLGNDIGTYCAQTMFSTSCCILCAEYQQDQTSISDYFHRHLPNKK